MARRASRVLALIAVTSLVYSAFPRSTVKAQDRHWTPFTVAMVERRYSGNATQPAYVENYLYAVRGDGSNVTDYKRQIMPNRGWGDMRVITDLFAGKRIAVDPSTESLTTTPYSEKIVAHLATPPSACGPNPTPGPTILGYTTVVVKTTLPGPPDTKIERTTWEAPQLNCFALQYTVVLHQSDSSFSRNTREALLVKEGEPSAAMFEIPSGYVERSPSEVIAEHAKRFPNAPPVASDQTATMLDRVYQSYQKNH